MDGQIVFNESINNLQFKITDVTWSEADNQLKYSVSLYLPSDLTNPLVQRWYYVPLDPTTLASLQTTFLGLLKTQLDAGGLFTLQPLTQ